MKVERVSYSAIEALYQCEYKYNRLYGPYRLRLETDPMKVGTIMHDALCDFHSQDNMETLKNLFHNKWITSGILDNTLYNEGLKMVKAYETKFAPRQGEVVEREVRFELDVGLGIPVVGVIDRVDLIDEFMFNYEITDYKTGNYVKNQDEVDADMQLSIYDWALRKMWDEGYFPLLPEPEEVKLSLLYLKHGKYSTSRTDQDRKLVEDMLRATIEYILKLEDPKPKLNTFCRWCVVKSDCPLYQELLDFVPNFERVQNLSDDELLDIYKRLTTQEGGIKDLKTEIKQEAFRRMDKAEVSELTGGGWVGKPQSKSSRNYDIRAIRSIFEPIGVFEDIIKVDIKALKDIIKEHEITDEMLEGTFVVTSSDPYLSITKGKG
ncbi:MAG: PD-(D/E)XK nuclease family protein [Phycisphaerae bacterium]|jgi:hypothetical protein